MNRYSLRGEVVLQICPDSQIRDLNRRFRGVDSVTDVLTFPELPGEALLGEIAIGLDTARVQAALRGVSLEDELSYLAIHGVLHLAGLDDVEESDQAQMQRAMREIAQELGLPECLGWTSLYAGAESPEALPA